MDSTMIFDRNKLVVKLMWISLALGLVVDIMNKVPRGTVISLAVIGTFVGGGATFCTYRRVWEGQVKYIITVGLAVLSYLIISSNPHIGNYLLLYYCLAVVTLYHDFIPIILTGIVNLFFTNYFFIAFQDTMFSGLSTRHLISMNLYLVLITTVLAFQTRLGNKMKKSLEEQGERLKKDKNVLEKMFEKIRETTASLNAFNRSIISHVEAMGHISGEITTVASEIASGIQMQVQSVNDIKQSIAISSQEATALSETSTSMKILSGSTVDISNEGNNEVKTLQQQINDVGENINDTVVLMEQLNNQSQQIGSILDVINEIASQTNLLALNAAIEAARAGEHGRGFAVVADEIRKLAENSKHSTAEIVRILNELQNKAKQATEKVDTVLVSFHSSQTAAKNAEKIFGDIHDNTTQVLDKAEEMDEQIKNLQGGSEAIANEAYSISSTTEETSASVEEVTASIIEQNTRIERIIEEFRKLEELGQQLNQIVQ